MESCSSKRTVGALRWHHMRGRGVWPCQLPLPVSSIQGLVIIVYLVELLLLENSYFWFLKSRSWWSFTSTDDIPPHHHSVPWLHHRRIAIGWPVSWMTRCPNTDPGWQAALVGQQRQRCTDRGHKDRGGLRQGCNSGRCGLAHRGHVGDGHVDEREGGTSVAWHAGGGGGVSCGSCYQQNGPALRGRGLNPSL